MNDKVQQIEAYLVNKRWLPYVEFTWLAPSFQFVTLAAGLVELATVVLYYKAERAS